MTGPPDTDRLHETFALLSDEHRVAILAALWGDGTEPGPQSFSTLRERVGMADSGRFNYHLDRLTPQFVRETESGYALTHAGRRVIGLAAAGGLTEAPETTTDPVDVGTCPNCGGSFRARYDRGALAVDCADCDATGDRVGAPPVVAEAHAPADLPDVFGRRLLTDLQRLARGFCIVCDGPVERSPVVDTDAERLLDGDVVEEVHDCRACGRRRHSGVSGLLLDEPAVIAFLHERGIDLRKTPMYDLLGRVDVDAALVDRDPVRIEATLRSDGDGVSVTFDGDVESIASERV